MSTLSNVYEKIFYQEMYEYFNLIYVDSGRATTQQLFIQGKLTKALDKCLTTGMLLTDLTKAFDCISHDLIAKLNAYGFSTKSRSLIYDYTSHRKQRTKVNESYSSQR